jgi:hypothetical protein
MRYYSQLELEKIIEHLYDMQVASTNPEDVENTPAILKTRGVLMILQEKNRKCLQKWLNHQ